MPIGCDQHCPFKIMEIHSILTKIKLQKIQNSSALFSYWEWTSNKHYNRDETVFDRPLITSKWHYESYCYNLMDIHRNIDWNNFEASIAKQNHTLLQSVTAKDFCKRNTPHSSTIFVQEYNKYSRVINTILDSASPIIIATDGACKPNQTSSQPYIKATAAFTMGILDIRKHESIHTEEWTLRPLISLLCRISALPNMLGASDTDIAIAECHAFLMEELCLPAFLPRIIITDSEGIRNQVIHARDNFEGNINRDFIRSRIGGISKSIMGNLSSAVTGTSYKQKVTEAISTNPVISHLFDMLIERNSIFLNIAEKWTIGHKHSCRDESMLNTSINGTDAIQSIQSQTSHGTQNKAWKTSYFDSNNFKPILKVDSHQLCNHGLTIKTNPRYPSLIPNLCLLNANHIADSVAEFPFKTTFLANTPSLHRIYNPTSPLRFHFTINGDTVDKHISGAINTALIKERTKRLKTKTTQGLLWRLIDYVSDDWESLNLHRGLLRSLHGLSRTHTRCLYKSENYREGSWRDYLISLQNDSSTSQIPPTPTLGKIQRIKLLSPCKWCPNNNGTPSRHGNRMRALLLCDHPDLKYFRSNVDLLITKKLQELVQLLRRCTSDSDAQMFLVEIQNIFMSLQISQTGRLKRVPTSTNLTYLSIDRKAQYNKPP